MTKLNKFITAVAAVVLAGCTATTEDAPPAPDVDGWDHDHRVDSFTSAAKFSRRRRPQR